MKKVVKKLEKIKNSNSEEFATKGDIRQLGVMMEDIMNTLYFIKEIILDMSNNLDNMNIKLASYNKISLHKNS